MYASYSYWVYKRCLVQWHYLLSTVHCSVVSVNCWPTLITLLISTTDYHQHFILIYMHASYMYTYAMLGYFSERMCCIIISILATCMCIWIPLCGAKQVLVTMATSTSRCISVALLMSKINWMNLCQLYDNIRIIRALQYTEI